MAPAERFDRDLMARIREVIDDGDVIETLGQRRPNVVERIDDFGIEITTLRSAAQGRSHVVPDDMFNTVWRHLWEHGRAERQYFDTHTPGPRIGRCAAAFAVLGRLRGVDVVSTRPVVITMAASAG